MDKTNKLVNVQSNLVFKDSLINGVWTICITMTVGKFSQMCQTIKLNHYATIQFFRNKSETDLNGQKKTTLKAHFN